MSGLHLIRSGLLRADDHLALVEAWLVASLVVLLTGVTFAQVVSRYVFDDPLIWSEEAARYLFVWVSLVGAALGIREGAHYGLDAVLRQLPQPARIVCGIVAGVVMAAFLLILLVTGIDEVRLASTQDSATLPMRMHWAYLALPAGATLGLLHLGAHLLRFGFVTHPLDAKVLAD